MLDLEEIRKRLSYCNLKKVSRETGVNYHTVWQVKNQTGDAYQYKTIKRLSDFFEGK